MVDSGDVVVGVVYNPARDEMFSAVRGGGAWIEVGGGSPEPIRVSVRTVDERITLLASRTEIAAGELAMFNDTWRVQPTGSTAYKLACVAWCRGEAFLSRTPKSEWDICAGALLVTEAGGSVTDLRGGALRFNRAEPYVHGVIASNVALHAVLRHRLGGQARRSR
jgi:myo-inositol-1(or 4)-monophosphatase